MKKQTTKPKAELKRDIGLLGSAFLVLNGVIGAGIFGLPGRLSLEAGDFSPWLFPLAGVLMLFIVLPFAELASRFDKTGGPVLYTYTAFGPFVSFQTGWVLFISRAASTAANANVLVTYSTFFWPFLAGEEMRAVALVVISSLLIWINIVGVKKTVRAIDIFSVLKVLPVLGIVALGFKHVAPEALFTAHIPEVTDVEGIALLLLYAFIGFENSQIPAGETSNPRKTIPKALVITVLLITVFYFLVQLVFDAAPLEIANPDAPLIDLGIVLAGSAGGIAITLAAIFSISGNIITGTVAGSRLVYCMAEEEQLPAWFRHVHEKFSTPDNSIWFFGLAVAGLAVSGTFVYLAVVSSLARLVAYGLSIAAIPRIRKLAGAEDETKTWRLPGGLIIPAIGLAFCIYAAAQATPGVWKMFGIMLLIGLGSYWLGHLARKPGNP